MRDSVTACYVGATVIKMTERPCELKFDVQSEVSTYRTRIHTIGTVLYSGLRAEDLKLNFSLLFRLTSNSQRGVLHRAFVFAFHWQIQISGGR